jgi:site-specific recombinase XerD
LLEGFAQQLCQAGYAELTARRHVRAVEHLIHWIGLNGGTVAALDERMIEEFVQHLNRCRCPRYGRAHRRDLRTGARLFLRYFRFADLVTTRVGQEIIVDPALLVSFRGWMRQQRGACEATLYNYSSHVRDLLKSLGEDPETFDAHSLRQFVLDTSQRCGWAAAKKCTTAIRMFLRFLIADGKCAAGLDSSIPVLAHWRLSSLPRYLQSDEVERVIASCDPATPMGKRDRAILLLLARLGLRAGDIVQLRLGDVDWKEAGISVSGKGRRQTLMPLTQEIGNAIASYIKDGRPPTTVDALFVRSRAPFRALANHCAISMIVAQAMLRANVTCPSRGAAHVVRHSVASSMLRQGSSLQEIAGVLRHRSIATNGGLRQSRCRNVATDCTALAGGEIMLTQAVTSYIAVRRATGFAFRSEGSLLQSFAAFPTPRANSMSALRPPLSGLDWRRDCFNERAGLAR